MLKLYFCPGACSLASHIGLEETGAPYELEPVMLAKKQQQTPEYLKINPRGKVPTLSIDGKSLVENTAILTYLARKFPEKKLLPADEAEAARCIATMCWFSSIVHPSYQRTRRPERFSADPAAHESIKENGKKSYWENCREIDSMIQGHDWVMGHQYTVVDPYALVFYGWGLNSNFPMQELKAYTAWRDRMIQRPAVKKSIEAEEKVAG
jgi:glutathione S-transferase